MSSFQHTADVAALGSLCELDAVLMLMQILFLQMTGASWLWPMLPLNFVFLVVAVYAPNIAAEMVSFFRRLALFLDDPKIDSFSG